MGEIHEISTKIEVKFDLMRAAKRAAKPKPEEGEPKPERPPASASQPTT